MANPNKEAIMKLCSDINKKEGEGSIFSLGGTGSNLKIKRWSTRIEDMDAIIGGGMPEGRIIEIYGPESSGKTSLGYHLASLHPMCLYIPIEGTFDADRAKQFGNTPKQMIVYRARYGEQAMNKMLKFAEAGIPLIILDSVAACKPKEDIDKLKKAAGNDEEFNNRMGGVARLMHNYLPVLEEVIEKTGTTIVLINQVRAKMNAMPFGDQTDTPGGMGPKFYSSIRIQVARRAWIEVPNKDPRNSATNQKIGLIMKLKVIKSKVSNPMGEAEIPMFFHTGFESYDDIKKIRSEYMAKAKPSKKREAYDEDSDE